MILNKKRIVRISWISTRTSPAATRLPRCLRLSALGESLSLSLKRYFKSPFVRLIIFDIIISIPEQTIIARALLFARAPYIMHKKYINFIIHISGKITRATLYERKHKKK